MPDPPPDQSFEPDLPEPSDEEIDEWLAEWEEADRHAAGVLRQALADHLGDSVPEAALVQAGVRLRHGLRSDGHPLAWVRRAAGLTDVELTASDEKLLVRCVAATISPVEETGLEPDEEATIISLEHADWLGAIISAVRSGPGSWAAASDLAAGVDSCPEVNTAGNVDDSPRPRPRLGLESRPARRLRVPLPLCPSRDLGQSEWAGLTAADALRNERACRQRRRLASRSPPASLELDHPETVPATAQTTASVRSAAAPRDGR